MKNKIEAVIFDMDGVLIDAKDWHYEALNKALSIFGMEISRYDHLTTFDGLPTSKKLQMLSKEKNLPISLHPFINDLKQIYTLEEVMVKCKPKFNHQYMMSKLRNEGYRIVCCSNSIKQSIEMMMDKAKLNEYLEFFLSNEDVTHPKPNPEIYLKAFEKLGLKAEQCLIAEDNFNGIKAAIDSGGYLFKVSNTDEVNYINIKKRISQIEKGKIDG